MKRVLIFVVQSSRRLRLRGPITRFCARAFGCTSLVMSHRATAFGLLWKAGRWMWLQANRIDRAGGRVPFATDRRAAPRWTLCATDSLGGEKHGVDENLIHRIILVESNFNPKAVSRKSALGLMQLLPETAAHYSVRNVFDPAQNIEGGTRYIKDLLARYHGDLTLALAAYNAGPQMVQRYGGIPPFPETQNYVRRITTTLKCNPTTDARKCSSSN